MRRLVFRGPRQVEVEAVPMPRPGPGQALVRAEWSLISTGTEMTAYTGDFPRPVSAWAAYVRYPFTPGYSAVGTVEAAGPGCALEPGQRIVAEVNHASAFLVDAPAGAAAARPANWLVCPEGVDPADATFHTLGRIVVNGLRLSRVQFGECAAVIGCGLLGQLAIRVLGLAGALPVFAVDLAAARLEQARRSGADELLQAGSGDLARDLRERNAGRLADVVVDVTGAPGSFPLATRLARDLGRVVVLGSPRGPVTIDLHDDVHTRGLQVIGAHAGTTPRAETPHTPWTMRRNTEYCLTLIRTGRLRVRDLISHRFPLSRAGEAYAMLDEDRTRAMGVLLDLGA